MGALLALNVGIIQVLPKKGFLMTFLHVRSNVSLLLGLVCGFFLFFTFLVCSLWVLAVPI